MIVKNSDINSTTSTLKMNEIKIIRLNSGEDIIAEFSCDKRKKTVQLNNPMHIVFKRTPSGSIMMIFPWLPIELLKDNNALIKMSDILTVVDPKEDLIVHYHKLIKQAEETLLRQPDIINQFEEMEDDEEDEEKTLSKNEFTDLVNRKKNNLLH